MRNVLLLLIAVIGLYSFSGTKEERDAFITKSIEQRVKSVGMTTSDITLLKVEPISERDYERYVQRGTLDAIAGKETITYSIAKRPTKEESKRWKRVFEEKLSKFSNEKNFGYFVKVTCRFAPHPMNDRSLWTTYFVVSDKAGTEIATRF